MGGRQPVPRRRDRVGGTGSTQGIAVSYDRPYDSITGAGQFFARDVAMVRFLERYGYPVSYTTSESVDQAPASSGATGRCSTSATPSTGPRARRRAFARAARAGTSLLFLGSDTLGWRARFLAHRLRGRQGPPDDGRR